MKLKSLLLALFTAGFAVSIAVAASPAAVEKGKPTVSVAATGTDTTGATTTSESKKGKGHAKKAAVACKPAAKILLKGEFVAAAANGFAMTVSGGNKPAKAWKGKQATVLVDDKSKFKGKKRSLAELAAGDRLNVQGYACKADVAAGTVLARMVMSKGPKGADDDEAGTTTGATTTTATTTGTTTAVTTTTAATTTTAVTTTTP